MPAYLQKLGGPAQEILYKDVILKDVNQVRSLLQVLKSRDDIRLNVESVCLDNDRVEQETRHEETLFSNFIVIARLFPNLKAINITKSTDYDFWKHLIKTIDEGKWKKLQRLPLSPNATGSAATQNYQLATWALKDRLEQMDVQDSITNLIRLNHFEKLKSLDYVFRDHQAIFNIDKHLQPCPSLQSLSMQIGYDLLVKRQHNDGYPRTIDLSSVNARPNVKKLQAVIMLVYGSTIVCLMHVFPKLDKLDICFPTSPEFSTNITRQFFQYLAKIPTYSITNFPVKNVVDAVADLHENVDELGIGYRWDYGPEKATYRLKLDKDSKLTGKKTEIVADAFYKLNGARTLPHMDLFDKFGDDLTIVHIIMGESQDSMIGDDKTIGYYVDQVFQKCLKLEKLRLKETYLLECDPDLHMENGRVALTELNIVFIH